MADVLRGARDPSGGVVRERGDDLLRAAMIVYALALVACVALPMAALLQRSLLDPSGSWVGFAHYRKYLESPAFLSSLRNSTTVALATAALVVPMAFAYAYALSRSCMPGKGFFRAAVYLPLLIPGILKAIALIYLFGNQGLLKSWLMGGTLYGPVGVVAASVMWTFPHAVLIVLVSLLNADRRLYQAAEVLHAGAWRTFLHVTWPACRYGVVTAFLSVFVMVFTDFGIAKVIGGNFNLLATDIYKEVVGLQNFEMGAVICVVLMLPAVLVFVLAVVPLLPLLFNPEDMGRKLATGIFVGLCTVVTVFIPWDTAIASNGMRALVIVLWAVLVVRTAIGVHGAVPDVVPRGPRTSPDMVGIDTPLTRADAVDAGRVLGIDEDELDLVTGRSQ